MLRQSISSCAVVCNVEPRRLVGWVGIAVVPVVIVTGIRKFIRFNVCTYGLLSRLEASTTSRRRYKLR